MNANLQAPRILIAVGFLMLLLTSLQGWAMVGIIAIAGESQAALLQEFKRLHNLGLAGGFLAIAFGLTMIVLALDPARIRIIYSVLLPSLLIAPVGFADRASALLLGGMPMGVQAVFFGLQAISAIGITVSLVLILAAIVRQNTTRSA